MARTARREVKAGREIGWFRWPIHRVSARDDARRGVVPDAREAGLLPGGPVTSRRRLIEPHMQPGDSASAGGSRTEVCCV